ncbi:MAG: AraC family transcriptional regulator [Chitinophagaceae bacterium]|nr:MAG: AraC family transcriptional regulator [Chitinophagaceae bacterium]
MPPKKYPALPARVYQRDVVQGMVPMTLVRLLGQYLQTQGVALHEVGFPPLPGDDARELGRFPAEDYCQLLIRAAERLQDPLLGLHLGQTIRPTQLGALGYVLLACESLGAALMRIQRYHRLVHDINPIEHHVVGDQLELRWGVSHGKPGALFDEAGIASIVQFTRDLCGPDAPSLTAVDFVNPAPPDPRPYTRYLGCPVRFGQPVTRLVVPLACLALPLRQPDPALLRLMEDQVDVALAQLPEAGDLADMTQRVVTHLARHGIPELEQVAQELRLSPRVFYRRLAEQGLNFRDLREAALRQVAELHLRDERLTLAEVGMLLGYSEQSAFSRAFKRWAGVSPLQWRKAQAIGTHWVEG